MTTPQKARRSRGARRLARVSTELPGEMRRLIAPLKRRRAPPAGARPGEMAVPHDAPEPEIRVVAYRPDLCEERRLETADELAELLRASDRVFWIDVRGFGSRQTLERIGEILEIHPLALADVVNVPQRTKVETYGDRVLLITQMVRLLAGEHVDLEQVSLVLGPGWVATFQERPGDVFDPVRARIRSGTGRIRRMGADYLAYALVDAVVDGFFPVLEAIGATVEALEEEVMTNPTHETLERVHATRRLLLQLHRIQWRQRDALATLMRDESLPLEDAVRVYVRDAHDHAFQILDMIEAYRDLTVGLMDVYLSSASHRMNEVMKTLTVVATIFIPLTFLAGVYGMNFQHMPELRWRFGYAGIWLLMCAIAAVLLVWFRRRGWIELGGRRKDSDGTR